MKIIINTCYGGFSFNETAIQRYGIQTYDDDTATRTRADLIEAIEHGEDLSAPYAKLDVVEIPDEATDFAIEEYDGMENIVYVVNGKLNWT
jgi:hypothetical protein